MAFTRRFLKEILADYDNAAELIDEIIEAHVEAVAPLKAELDRIIEENGGKTYEELRAECDRIAAEIEREKAEYDAVKAEYDAFKAAAEAKSAYEEKAKAFRSMLIQEGVSRHVDMIVRASGDIINSMEMQDGKVRNYETISAAIRSECGDFIGKSKPMQTFVPVRTRESIMDITDRAERLAAIRNNRHLFRE